MIRYVTMLRPLFGPSYMRKMAETLGVNATMPRHWAYGFAEIGARTRARILLLIPSLREAMMERQRLEREAFERAALEFAAIHKAKPGIYRRVADEMISNREKN